MSDDRCLLNPLWFSRFPGHLKAATSGQPPSPKLRASVASGSLPRHGTERLSCRSQNVHRAALLWVSAEQPLITPEPLLRSFCILV